jgi:hypothetical protein
VRPVGALWVDAAFRQEDGVPFKDFIPKNPQPNTYVLALDGQSEYKPLEGVAIGSPEEAFAELQGELEEVATGLREAFADVPFSLTGDPDAASVLLAITAKYPFAGLYGETGQISAYTCSMTLMAYDALTHETIGELSLSRRYGGTVSVSIGSSMTWKMLPDLRDEEGAAEVVAFVNTLADYQRGRTR